LGVDVKMIKKLLFSEEKIIKNHPSLLIA